MTPRPAVVWSPAYEVDIGDHVYPTHKYRLVRERLLGEGVIREGDLSDTVAIHCSTVEEAVRVTGRG